MSQISCQDFRKFLDPYLDGEFDPTERADFDAHLAVCGACRGHYEQRAWLQQALRPALKRPTPMSAEAHERLRARLGTASRPARVRRITKQALLPLPAIAAAVALFIMSSPLQGFTVVDEAVSQHCRAVPVEVPAEQTDELNDWFHGKLSFELKAPQFRDDVVLLGGRLSQVGSEAKARRAAYLLYGVGQHKMTVLVFNRRGQDLHDLGEQHTVNGRALSIHDAGAYRVALYQSGPVGYAVTSDLPSQELLDLMGEAL